MFEMWGCTLPWKPSGPSLVGVGRGSSTLVTYILEGLSRSRANMAHVRQSRPNSGLGFQGIVLKTFEIFVSRVWGVPCPESRAGIGR